MDSIFLSSPLLNLPLATAGSQAYRLPVDATSGLLPHPFLWKFRHRLDLRNRISMQRISLGNDCCQSISYGRTGLSNKPLFVLRNRNSNML